MGVVPRPGQQIFEFIELDKHLTETSFRVYYKEIYQNKVTELLSVRSLVL